MTTSSYVSDIFYNVLGGAIVALGTMSAQYLRRKYRNRKFKQVFGEDVDQNYNIVYPTYLTSPETVFEMPPSQVTRERHGTGRLTVVNSTAASRSISHLGYTIGTNAKRSPHIKAHTEVDEDWGISFISIGGLNNFKSVDLLNDPANSFIRFGPPPFNTIVTSNSGSILVQLRERGVDYGLIVKINPTNNLNRIWICCAGFLEWGTSGAAWWLANRWKEEIYPRARNRPFACITRTQVGSDESTTLLQFFLSGEEAENAASMHRT